MLSQGRPCKLAVLISIETRMFYAFSPKVPAEGIQTGTVNRFGLASFWGPVPEVLGGVLVEGEKTHRLFLRYAPGNFNKNVAFSTASSGFYYGIARG